MPHQQSDRLETYWLVVKVVVLGTIVIVVIVLVIIIIVVVRITVAESCLLLQFEPKHYIDKT